MIRDNEGMIQSVRYDELAPMLLQEVQPQQHTILAQAQQLAAEEAHGAAQAEHSAVQDAEIGLLKNEIAELKKANAATQTAISKMLSGDARVEMR